LRNAEGSVPYIFYRNFPIGNDGQDGALGRFVCINFLFCVTLYLPIDKVGNGCYIYL